MARLYANLPEFQSTGDSYESKAAAVADMLAKGWERIDSTTFRRRAASGELLVGYVRYSRSMGAWAIKVC